MKLGLEPTKDDIDSNAAIGVVVDGGDLLGGDGRCPGSWKECGNDFKAAGGVEERL